MVCTDIFHRFKVVFQKDAMQCGVACLAMVCFHFGKAYTTRWLQNHCHVGPDGASMKGISDAAQKLGLECVGSRLSIADLERSPLPAILHWNGNHFVVLHKIERGGQKFHIADPAHGNISLGREEFKCHWCPDGQYGDLHGIGLFFQKTERFGRMQEPKRKRGATANIYAGELRKHKGTFIHIFLSLLLAGGLQLGMPFLMQATVDIGIARRNLTVLTVAHRLSTVRYADRIIVMAGGTIVERGTHEELISLKGHYYNLVQSQLQI